MFVAIKRWYVWPQQAHLLGRRPSRHGLSMPGTGRGYKTKDWIDVIRETFRAQRVEGALAWERRLRRQPTKSDRLPHYGSKIERFNHSTLSQLRTVTVPSNNFA
jgi:hypothetical protein